MKFENFSDPDSRFRRSGSNQPTRQHGKKARSGSSRPGQYLGYTVNGQDYYIKSQSNCIKAEKRLLALCHDQPDVLAQVIDAETDRAGARISRCEAILRALKTRR